MLYSEKGMKNLRESGLKNSVDNFKKRVYKTKVFILQCKVCEKEFIVNYKKKKHTTCSNECKNKAHAIFNFKQNKTYAKSGYYQGVYCASSWELAFLVFNKDLGNNIRRCEKYFNYEINEEKHLYFPDFIMDDIIYEIKGRELEDVEIRAQAVRSSGVEIEIFRRKEIMPLIKYVQQM